MAYPHKWSPISYKSSAGQRKHIGQRPMHYRWTTGNLRVRPRRYWGRHFHCSWASEFILQPREVLNSSHADVHAACVPIDYQPSIIELSTLLVACDIKLEAISTSYKHHASIWRDSINFTLFSYFRCAQLLSPSIVDQRLACTPLHLVHCVGATTPARPFVSAPST